MRKFFFLTFLSTLLAFTINAKDKIGIAPEIGLNLSNMSSNDAAVTNYLKPGFKVGLNFDKLITSDLSLQIGAFFTQTGSKMDVNIVFVGPVMVPISVYNAQVPVNLFYKMSLGRGNMIFSAGPYLGYALSISAKPSDTSFKTTNLKIGTDTSSFIKPLDIGVNIAVGYQLTNGIFAKLGYAASVTNIAAQSGQTIRNSVFSFSIGWFFRSTSSIVKGKKKTN